MKILNKTYKRKRKGRKQKYHINTIKNRCILFLSVLLILGSIMIVNAQDNLQSIIIANQQKINTYKIKYEKLQKEKNILEKEKDKMIEQLQKQLQNTEKEIKKRTLISNGNIYIFTQEEVDIWARLVCAESTGSSLKDKTMTAEVIRNRLLHNNFPDTINEVVFQKNQFQPTFDGRFEQVTVTKNDYEAVYKAIQGSNYTNNALFFANILVCKNSNKINNGKQNATWFETKLKKVATGSNGHSYWTLK